MEAAIWILVSAALCALVHFSVFGVSLKSEGVPELEIDIKRELLALVDDEQPEPLP